jgi:cytochrome P450
MSTPHPTLETMAPTDPTDPVKAVVHPDPYPYYATLRDGPPLAWNATLRLWVASRAEVIETLLQAHGALRVRPAAEPVPRAIVGQPAGEVFGHLVRMNEGAAHQAHRPALQRALAGLDLQGAHATALEAATGTRALPLSDALFSIPLRAVARLLGFGDAALPRVDGWMRDFVACLSPLSSEAQLGAASVAAAALMTRFEALAADGPATRGTLLTAVREAEPAGTPPSRALLANLVGLLSQTCDATAGLLGNGLIAWRREPAAREAAATRDGLQMVVQETARHDPSVHNTRRFVAEPVDIAGTTLAAGDAVLLVLAAANRDPGFNPEPDRFQPLRARRRMLGFGHGLHACPGQALACTLAAAGLEALLRERRAEVERLLERGWRYRPSVNGRIPQFD